LSKQCKYPILIGDGMESLKFFKGQFMRKKRFDVIEHGSLFHSQPVKKSLF